MKLKLKLKLKRDLTVVENANVKRIFKNVITVFLMATILSGEWKTSELQASTFLDSLPKTALADKLAAARAKSNTMPYRPNQILVKLNDSNGTITTQRRRISSILKRILPGSRYLRRLSRLSSTALIELPTSITVDEAVVKLNRIPGIALAEPNFLYQTFQTIPNDTEFNKLWGLNNTGQPGQYGEIGIPDMDIDAPEAWDLITATTAAGNHLWTGEEVYVGVIDTGINYLHPDLRANIWTNPNEVVNGLDDDNNGYVDDIHGISSADATVNPMAIEHHGTHIAGTIAAVGDNDLGIAGVSWGAKIIPCRFIQGISGNVGSASDAIECLDYILELKESGMNIVATNNSWGNKGSLSELLREAIQRHEAADILFIAAAGNWNTDNDDDPVYPASYDLDNIISVANVDSSGKLSQDSCFGSTSVDIAAPGDGIYSTYNEDYYEYLYGTSMATPHVTGAAALLKSSNPELTGAEIKAQLFANGKPLDSLRGKTVTGKMIRAIAMPQQDTDTDGITDSWETAHDLDPNTASDAAADPDEDGLTNLEEYSLDCEPHIADSDGDGINDGLEKNKYATNPKSADTDADGLSDSDELSIYLTDPLRVDSDGDHRPDGIEIESGTDPNDSDTDGDGVWDNIEARMHTDPTDPAEYPTAWPLRVGLLTMEHALLPPGIDLLRTDLLKTSLISEVSVLDPCTSKYCETRHKPTVDELLAYDAIFVLPYTYGTTPETGDLLADYSDAGGAVVVSGGRSMEGRWQRDGYDPFILTDNQWTPSLNDFTNYHSESIQIIDHTHPIMNGIETFNGGIGSIHYRTSLTRGAVAIARWTSGYPLIAVKESGQQRHVALNFIPFSNGTSALSEGMPMFQIGGWLEQTDGAYIIANALQYAAFGDAYATSCNDHDHCTADRFDPLQGCYNTPVYGYCLCEEHTGTLQEHYGNVRVRTESVQDCSDCLLGCSLPIGCSEDTSRYYTMGANEDLGTDPDRVVTLYTEDHRATWSQTPCGIERQCTRDSDCIDDNFCDGAKICINGACQDDDVPVICDDGAGCTTDICNEMTDSCDFIPNDTACNDGKQCTTDQCDPASSTLPTGCVNTPDPNCSITCQDIAATVNQHVIAGRANANTEKDCSSCYFDICGLPSGCEVDNTSYRAAGSNQDMGTNGNISVTLYSEDNGVTWRIGQCAVSDCTENSQCDDSIACTTDSCNTESSECVYTPVDEHCTAGVCETARCDGNMGCIIESEPNCCGNGTCETGEDSCSCAEDCGASNTTETLCNDMIDNDCDGTVDDKDSDCQTLCVETGDFCLFDRDCCDGLTCDGLLYRTCR